ncbi:uncharacterized protein LOC131309448 [Rhododendron vialii]|uniref:uncharacterized protein LOC131309448 n=1 Tax=Rhododendron vialii TaxID=182163 RepID=UPI00265FEEFA|nr:uncharacterized protein LOC131309448 [Rhododendron vialii]
MSCRALRYTLVELQRFTILANSSAFLRPECAYAIYQRQYLAEPLRVMTHQAVVGVAMEARQERRGQSSRSKGETAHSRERSNYAVATGLPRLSWTLAVRDAQGEATIVPSEWAEEAFHLMLAMEKEFHKIASGTPLRLKYPSMTPALASVQMRPQGQARAAFRRKSVQPPPQKKTMTDTSTTPAGTQRQTSASQPVVSVQRGAKSATTREETRFRIKLRERPQQKGLAEKRRKGAFDISDHRERERGGGGGRGR